MILHYSHFSIIIQPTHTCLCIIYILYIIYISSSPYTSLSVYRGTRFWGKLCKCSKYPENSFAVVINVSILSKCHIIIYIIVASRSRYIIERVNTCALTEHVVIICTLMLNSAIIFSTLHAVIRTIFSFFNGNTQLFLSVYLNTI